ncbi:probable CLIP-associating protein 2 [Coccomyxa sp. Obi]|nr:probable CLIP-associating protein 2 [Coccomyxa sp. Obi]
MRSPHSPTASSRCSNDSTESEPVASAVSSRASSIANVSTRRGGFMDSGGYTASGEVPQAQPIHVAGERQLRAELDGLIRQLSADEEWTRRIDALLRLEGLVRGGAAGLPGFAELLKSLQEPIVVQVLDRRSAVSRQACHLISVLAEHMGARLETVAMAFLAALFKVLVITVQIMADSADACARVLLRHCQSPRLLPRLCSTLCKDRSAKLRQFAAEYLIQVLEEWDSAALDRSLAAIEEAVLAAAQDAVADTRSAGRAAFAAYCRARPERMHPLLASQNSGLQQKLRDALDSYAPGAAAAAAAASAKAPARRQSVLPAPPTRHASAKPSTAGARFSAAGPALAAPAAAADAGSAAPPPRRPPANSRKSIAGGALRMTLPGVSHDEEARTRQAPVAAHAVVLSRVPAVSEYHHQDFRGGTSSFAHEAGPPGTHSSSRGHSSLGCVMEGYGAYNEPRHGPPLSQLLQAFASAGADWKARTDAFAALEEAMRRHDAAAGVPSHLDRLVTVFLENISDAHVRVATACLRCLGATLGACGALLERHLDRLVPPLLVRAADGKEAVRRAAADALAVLPGVVSADVFLSTLTAAVGAAGVVSADVFLLTLTAAVGNARSTKAQTAAIDTFTAVAPLLRDIGPPALRSWAACMATAAQDKHKEVRRAAEVALSAIHRHLDSAAVSEALSSEPPDAQAGLLRNLQAMSLSKREVAAHLPAERAAAPAADAAPDAAGAAFPPRPLTPANGSPEQPAAANGRLAGIACAHAAPPGRAVRPTEERGPAANEAAGGQGDGWKAPAPPPFAAQRENAGGAAAPSPKAAGAELSSPGQRQAGAAAPLVDVSNLPALASPPSQPPPHASSPPAYHAVTPTTAEQQHRGFPGATHAASPALTPPTAFRMSFPRFATADDAKTYLEGFVAGLASSDATSCLAALPGILPAIPLPLWHPHMPQVMRVIREAATGGELEARKQALVATQLFAAKASPVLAPHFADLAPVLLDCASDPSREVRLLAQQAMDDCMADLPVQSICLPPLLLRCQQTDTLDGEAAALQALFRSMSQVVKRMGAAGADTLLGTPLLPCLVRAFGHASADVRKAVVFCLVELRLAVEESKLAPKLADLSATQQKLLDIYVERTRQQQQQQTAA